MNRVELSPWDEAPLLTGVEYGTPATLSAAWGTDARVLLVDHAGRFRADPFGTPTAGSFPSDAAYLGSIDGVEWFAQRTSQPQPDSVRDVAGTPQQRTVVFSALAWLNWVENARFCERCGAPLKPMRSHAICSACSASVFPRIDPSVIVALLDESDRLFLAHNSVWSTGRISLLAGFVEAGESAENALHREVSEESGLVLGAHRYLGSQPWPFPRSLMLGYVARSGGDAVVDGEEIAWGNWYAREQLERLVGSGEVALPGIGSIARAIIDTWWTGSLPSPEG